MHGGKSTSGTVPDGALILQTTTAAFPDVSSFEDVQVGKTGRADEELPPAKRMRATAAAK
jgi:hypothetical protein